MKKFKKKGFTLIELISVLVIMAIIALIATPLVMSIIRKARISADKRSIDAYGRSIELAIAGYLMDTGKFATSIEQLTIEYSGEEVACSTTNLNSDSSVYLAGCTVGGRSVEGYTYGKEEIITYDAYEVGDEIRYNNVDYRVIKDSGINESTVTLLKVDLLTVAEVNQYGGVGTENNHVNMYATSNTTASYYQTAYNFNGYGGMQYYSSETCNGYGTSSGCKSDYESSEVKYVVDAWKTEKAPAAIEARLIMLEDLTDNLGMQFDEISSGILQLQQTEDSPMWIFGENYGYWTMTSNGDNNKKVWYVYVGGNVELSGVSNYNNCCGYIFSFVRPVIVLPKSAISS